MKALIIKILNTYATSGAIICGISVLWLSAFGAGDVVVEFCAFGAGLLAFALAVLLLIKAIPDQVKPKGENDETDF